LVFGKIHDSSPVSLKECYGVCVIDESLAASINTMIDNVWGYLLECLPPTKLADHCSNKFGGYV